MRFYGAHYSRHRKIIYDFHNIKLPVTTIVIWLWNMFQKPTIFFRDNRKQVVGLIFTQNDLCCRLVVSILHATVVPCKSAFSWVMTVMGQPKNGQNRGAAWRIVGKKGKETEERHPLSPASTPFFAWLFAPSPYSVCFFPLSCQPCGGRELPKYNATIPLQWQILTHLDCNRNHLASHFPSSFLL